MKYLFLVGIYNEQTDIRFRLLLGTVPIRGLSSNGESVNSKTPQSRSCKFTHTHTPHTHTHTHTMSGDTMSPLETHTRLYVRVCVLQQALTHPSFRMNYGTNADHARNSLTNCGKRQLEYGDKRIHFIHTRKRGRLHSLYHIVQCSYKCVVTFLRDKWEHPPPPMK